MAQWKIVGSNPKAGKLMPLWVPEQDPSPPNFSIISVTPKLALTFMSVSEGARWDRTKHYFPMDISNASLFYCIPLKVVVFV